MSENRPHSLDLRTATGQEINQAMSRGVVDALREHKRTGTPAAIWDWEKNCVVIVPPEEIVVPDEEAREAEPIEARDEPRA